MLTKYKMHKWKFIETNHPTSGGCFLSLLQVLRLQEEKDLLKKSSEQEVDQLWSQLESMRASRQELGGEADEPGCSLIRSKKGQVFTETASSEFAEVSGPLEPEFNHF